MSPHQQMCGTRRDVGATPTATASLAARGGGVAHLPMWMTHHARVAQDAREGQADMQTDEDVIAYIRRMPKVWCPSTYCEGGEQQFLARATYNEALYGCSCCGEFFRVEQLAQYPEYRRLAEGDADPAPYTVFALLSSDANSMGGSEIEGLYFTEARAEAAMHAAQAGWSPLVYSIIETQVFP